MTTETAGWGTRPAVPLILLAAAMAVACSESNMRADGMPAYADFSDREVEGLRHYIRQQAENALAQAGQ
jgi:mono/diheme cytochrome c family protein